MRDFNPRGRKDLDQAFPSTLFSLLYFNPRGRKDLDKVIGSIEQFDDISIHEVAKTSTVQAVVAAEYLENFNPRGRKDLDAAEKLLFLPK